MKKITLLNEKTNKKLGYRLVSERMTIDFSNTVAKEAGIATTSFKDTLKITNEEFKKPSTMLRYLATDGNHLNELLQDWYEYIDNTEELMAYHEIKKIKYKPERLKTSKNIVFKGGISVILHGFESYHGEYRSYDDKVTVTLLFKTKKAIKEVARLSKVYPNNKQLVAKDLEADFDRGKKYLKLTGDGRFIWTVISDVAQNHYGIVKNGFHFYDYNEYSSSRIDKQLNFPFETFPSYQQMYYGTTADGDCFGEYVNSIREGIKEGKIHYYPDINESQLSRIKF